MRTPGDFGRLAIRFLLCLVTAVIISWTAYLCAWLRFGDHIYFQDEQLETIRVLEGLRKDIDYHQKTTGKFPVRLTDLEAVKRKRVRLDEAGNPVDPWGRPLQYRVEGDGYVLYSFGRDGQVGGTGQDADLYARQVESWNEFPTLERLATFEGIPGIHLACILAGVFALPLCFMNATGKPGNRPGLMRVLLVNALTAVFAIGIAVVMSALHLIPSGH